jgi:hypothetical protein
MKSNIPCFHSYVENKQSKIDDDDGGGTWVLKGELSGGDQQRVKWKTEGSGGRRGSKYIIYN